jgi:hypothetical protein
MVVGIGDGVGVGVGGENVGMGRGVFDGEQAESPRRSEQIKMMRR